MKVHRRQFLTLVTASAAAGILRLPIASVAMAQEGLGPFMPHEGGVLTTAWTNGYGPDAESWIRFTNVTADSYDIAYSSSRGTKALRRLRASDRAAARTLVLGYNAKMPLVIENTTTLGASTAVMDDLRKSGRAELNLIPDTSLNEMRGSISFVRNFKVQVLVDGTPASIPVVETHAHFALKKKTAEGSMFFLDNRNSPLLLEYSLQFSGEKVPRTEQIVGVTAGGGERSAMQQALATVRSYTTRGIHFDFDKASIRSDSKDLLTEIATTLSNNPLWTLEISGHTDSIGKAKYNQALSEKRAASIKNTLIAMGVAEVRLSTRGLGASDPVASNKTLEGRAQNRRVVLTRTDR